MVPVVLIPGLSESVLLWPGVLLLTVILLDRENKSFAGLSMDQVLSYVTEVDYGTYIETWMENAVNDLQAL